MNKIWRLPLQENTTISTKFYFALWANERFTISLFSYVKDKQNFENPFRVDMSVNITIYVNVVKY